MKNIVIIGAGDLGKELVWLIEDINKVSPTFVILGFLDDDKSKSGTEFYGYRVLGGTEQLSELSKIKPLSAVVAIQDGRVRKRIVEAHPTFDNWENIIHPTACIARSCVMGKGNIVFPQVTISVDTQLGDFGLYYIQASIGNDCILGNYISVMQNTIICEHDQINDLCSIDVGTDIPPHTKYGFLKKVVLIGAGGFGRETAVIIEDINRFQKPTFELVGFLDDDERYKNGDYILGYPWLGTHKWAEENLTDIVYVCSVADVHIRAKIQNELMEKGVIFETIKAYGSYIADTAELGQGCVIYSGVMVSANARIGNGVLLNAFTTIGHDAVVNDYTTISPNVGVSGGCKIGAEVNIGGHSYLIPGRIIEDEAVIGAGSIVVTNVKKGVHVFGNPAKKIDF